MTMTHQSGITQRFSRMNKTAILSGLLVLPLAILALSSIFQPAFATSGWGCFQVINVNSGDALNMRASTSARSAIVDRLVPGQHGIIAENGPCLPANQPPSKQWCPLRHIDGSEMAEGWARLRYLAPSECP